MVFLMTVINTGFGVSKLATQGAVTVIYFFRVVTGQISGSSLSIG